MFSAPECVVGWDCCFTVNPVKDGISGNGEFSVGPTTVAYCLELPPGMSKQEVKLIPLNTCALGKSLPNRLRILPG